MAGPRLRVDGIVGARLGPNARLRAYRAGRPVFIQATFTGAFPWATELLCHRDHLWAVSNRHVDGEQLVEIVSVDRSLGIDHKAGWSAGTTVVLSIDGRSLRISTLSDCDLLAEAASAWSSAVSDENQRS